VKTTITEGGREEVSSTECQVIDPPSLKATPDPVAALNFASEHDLEMMRTDDWMKILREGEED
jgi:hypothetical protein